MNFQARVALRVDGNYFVMFGSGYDSMKFFFVRLRADFEWNFHVRFRLSVDRNYFEAFRSGCGSIDIFRD